MISHKDRSPDPEKQIDQLKEKYYTMKSKKFEQQPFTIPLRRSCNVGSLESIQVIRQAKNAIFITEEELICKHSMSYLPDSPLIKEDSPRTIEFLNCAQDEFIWNDYVENAENQRNAIGVTEEGKHIILQQSIRSSLPTCIAMLLLDHRKNPKFHEMEQPVLHELENAIAWLERSGACCIVTKLPLEERLVHLSKCLEKNGPGILTIIHPILVNHAIIIDSISIEKKEVVIRDPFHGWMVTVKSDTLKPWVHQGSSFIQII